MQGGRQRLTWSMSAGAKEDTPRRPQVLMHLLCASSHERKERGRKGGRERRRRKGGGGRKDKGTKGRKKRSLEQVSVSYSRGDSLSETLLSEDFTISKTPSCLVSIRTLSLPSVEAVTMCYTTEFPKAGTVPWSFYNPNLLPPGD